MPTVVEQDGVADQWNVTVTIYETDGTTLATVYKDANGDATGANPLPKQRNSGDFGVDTAGRWVCWLVPGDYQVGVHPAGGSETKTAFTVAAAAAPDVGYELTAVYGDRADGDVPAWNDTTKRLEWTAPSGGSSSVRELTFAFTHATAGLAAGVVAYTPTIGDTLLDAWIEVDTPWDGTTPKGDFGTFFDGRADGMLQANFGNAIVMDVADADDSTQEILNQAVIGATNPTALSGSNVLATPVRVVPAKLLTAHPIKVCVSTTGATDGDDPGATQGAAVLHLLVSTPTVSPG